MEPLASIKGLIENKFVSLFTNLLDNFGAEVEQYINNKLLEYQIEEYNRNYCAKTLLHRVSPRNLKDFYQPLFVRTLKKSANGSKQRIATHSVKELFNRRKYITLIGSAGSGKSTIVKYLFLNSIDTQYKIPIKVELRYLNEFGGSLIDFVKERIFKMQTLGTSDKIIEKLMSSGDFVLFLDGYDEVISSKKEKITKEIDDMVKVYSKNDYLLTSRPYTDIDLLPLFHNLEVCELSDDDISQFIRKQIPIEENELCEKIIQAVNSPENTSYRSFLANPLLLSMFILTFQSYSNIPQKRSEFYSQVFDSLYSVHDSMSKLAFVREKQSGLSKEEIVDVLKLFSFISYFDEKFVFSGLYIEEKLVYIKQKKINLKFDNQLILSDLQVAIGILNKEGTDYTFPHRSLQEYFAAIYISNLTDANKQIIYRRIVESLTARSGHRSSYRDNFHLLLSELDRRGVTQFAVIPLLNEFCETIDSQSIMPDRRLIIDQFLSLKVIYDTFYSILRSNVMQEADNSFNKKFTEYRYEASQSLGAEKTAGQKEEDDTFGEIARERLAKHDIYKFLQKCKSTVKADVESLLYQLESESRIDSEIISILGRDPF